jgi:nucleotide-binding universal stress UspA family protein
MFKRILVPTDGSARSDHAARAAIELARFLDASIVALYVYYPLRVIAAEPFVAEPAMIPEKAYVEGQQQAAKRYLGVINRAAKEANVHCTSRCVEHESIATAIVETASSPEEPCDLIFIGSHGRNLFSQMVLGSVTTKVQAMCEIPVLVYRDPHAFNTESEGGSRGKSESKNKPKRKKTPSSAKTEKKTARRRKS